MDRQLREKPEHFTSCALKGLPHFSQLDLLDGTTVKLGDVMSQTPERFSCWGKLFVVVGLQRDNGSPVMWGHAASDSWHKNTPTYSRGKDITNKRPQKVTTWGREFNENIASIRDAMDKSNHSPQNKLLLLGGG